MTRPPRTHTPPRIHHRIRSGPRIFPLLNYLVLHIIILYIRIIFGGFHPIYLSIYTKSGWLASLFAIRRRRERDRTGADWEHIGVTTALGFFYSPLFFYTVFIEEEEERKIEEDYLLVPAYPGAINHHSSSIITHKSIPPISPGVFSHRIIFFFCSGFCFSIYSAFFLFGHSSWGRGSYH